MLNKKVVYIGKKVLEPGKHFVLVNGLLQAKGYISRSLDVQGGEQYQLFVPSGYKINKYHTPAQVWIGKCYVDADTSEGYISYTNTVPVRVKVYEKDGERFCPEFGIPIKSKHR